MIQWWDTGAAHGASDKDLSALEDKYAIRLPEDFRAYLKAVMPEGNQWDHDGTKWWPLNEIKTVQEECKEWPDQYPPTGNGDKQLVFADWLIWCYGWAIDCSETENRGRVLKVVDGDEYVATSFNDFLDRYLRKDHSIYG